MQKYLCMKKSIGFLLVMLPVLAIFGGCMRNDDEPVLPQRPISRLYVSFENYQPDETLEPFKNLSIIDPADTTEMEVSIDYDASVKGGRGVHFNPFAGRVFQASAQDTIIRIMTVSDLGIPQGSGNIGFRELTAMRGLWYHNTSQYLYVVNNVNPTSIYAFFQPLNRNGYARPSKVFRLGDMRPWGLAMWKDSLLVARTGLNGGVSMYGNLSKTDSLEENFSPLSTLTVEGSTSIRGIAFSEELDLLVLADYGASGTDGGIYVIENAKALLSEPSATVTPTRVLRGTRTGLISPVDVAIDPREGKQSIYVADAGGNGAVLRFNLDDSGNVAPNAVVDGFSQNRTPAGLFLDARGRGAAADGSADETN